MSMTICPEELDDRIIAIAESRYLRSVAGWLEEWQHKSTPCYIRRGTLLLGVSGGSAHGLFHLYVIPADAVASLEAKTRSTYYKTTFPVDKEIAIEVSKDEGPWWDLLETEVALMEGEIRVAEATAFERESELEREKTEIHQIKMERAKEIVLKS